MDLILEVPNGLYIPKLNKDILYKMKKAGFCKIYFPIESGNEYIRNNIIRKPINIELVQELIAYCREINIETEGYFILGHFCCVVVVAVFSMLFSTGRSNLCAHATKKKGQP